MGQDIILFDDSLNTLEYVESTNVSFGTRDAAGEVLILADRNPSISGTTENIFEYIINKRTNLLNPNNITYPTTLAVVNALSALTTITITGATNIGGGIGLYSGLQNNLLELKTFVAQKGITIESTGDTINIGTSNDFDDYLLISNFDIYTGDTYQHFTGYTATTHQQFVQYTGDTYQQFTGYTATTRQEFVQYTGDTKNAIDAFTGTTLPTNYLHLDQTIPQSIVNGKPIIEGLQFDNDPNIGDFSSGKMYFDKIHGTLAVELDRDITLQLGQERQLYIYNDSGSQINNGSVVYISGTFGHYATVRLARADNLITSRAFGIATQNIPDGEMGYITLGGEVHDLNTSMWTSGTQLYLSDTIYGGLTSTPPTSPNATNMIGTVIVSDVSGGTILVDIHLSETLTSLIDVTIDNPLVDQILKYNGVNWINGEQTTASAGAGVDFYLDSTDIIPTGSTNVNKIDTLSRIPVTSPQVVDSYFVTSGNTPYFGGAFLYDYPLGGSQIDSGTWEFSTYAAVNVVTGRTSYITMDVHKVVLGSGSGTTTGTGTTRIFTASTGTTFLSGDSTGDRTTAGYVQTPSGLYEIVGYTSPTIVTIKVPVGYINESNIVYGVWRHLFKANTDTITTIAPNYSRYFVQVVESAYSINSTDKLGVIYFANSNKTTTVYLSHNGTTKNTNLKTPLVIRHNDIAGLQGGSQSERYHLTQAEYIGNGTGNFVRELSPSLTTPMLGVAQATSLQVNTNTSTQLLSLPNTACDSIGVINFNSVRFLHNYNSNIFLGYSSGNFSTTGCGNIGVGTQTLLGNTSGCYNTGVGLTALQNNTTGCYNTAMGYKALNVNCTGNNNTSIGTSTLFCNYSGSYNTAIGNSVLWRNYCGFYNTAIGNNSQYYNLCGSYNTSIGVNSLQYNCCGQYNTALGGYALYCNGCGCLNVGAGIYAGYQNISGCSNVFIGTCAGYTEKGSNKLYIANNASNPLIYGDFSAQRVGIGTTNPLTALHVNGQITSSATGTTAPFVVNSCALNTNLNADYLDGQHGSYYASVQYVEDNYALKTFAVAMAIALG